MCTKLIKPYAPTPLLEIFYFCLNINLKNVSFQFTKLCFWFESMCLYKIKSYSFLLEMMCFFNLKSCIVLSSI